MLHSFPDEVLTSKEAATILRVSRSTLLREAKAGAIPYRRLGRRYLFSKKELLDWLQAAPTADRPPTPAPKPAPIESSPHHKPFKIPGNKNDVVAKTAADIVNIIELGKGETSDDDCSG